MAARAEPLAARVGRRIVGAFCARQVRRSVDLTVEGREHLPEQGPLLLAARHVHHLLDGCILTGVLGRPLHILVAVDWTRPGPQRRLLDLATGVLRWPTVIREDAPNAGSGDESRRRLSVATREAVALLREGRALLVFPEGYPIVDPHPTPKSGLNEFLPFRHGFVRLATLAERAGAAPVPIVPVGFWYELRSDERWRVAVRLGRPVRIGECPSPQAAVEKVEREVRRLSAPPAGQAMD